MADIIAYIGANWVVWLMAPMAGVMAWVIKKGVAVVKRMDMLADAQQTVMVHQMFAIYNDALQRGGYITLAERAEADRLIKVYHNMHWNHNGDYYYRKVCELPVHDGVTEKYREEKEV